MCSPGVVARRAATARTSAAAAMSSAAATPTTSATAATATKSTTVTTPSTPATSATPATPATPDTPTASTVHVARFAVPQWLTPRSATEHSAPTAGYSGWLKRREQEIHWKHGGSGRWRCVCVKCMGEQALEHATCRTRSAVPQRCVTNMRSVVDKHAHLSDKGHGPWPMNDCRYASSSEVLHVDRPNKHTPLSLLTTRVTRTHTPAPRRPCLCSAVPYWRMLRLQSSREVPLERRQVTLVRAPHGPVGGASIGLTAVCRLGCIRRQYKRWLQHCCHGQLRIGINHNDVPRRLSIAARPARPHRLGKSRL